MGAEPEEEMVDGDGGYISDDSSFYGDDETRARLNERAEAFDPSTYWSTHHLRLATIAAAAQKAQAQAKTKASHPSKPTALFNPYEGQQSCRQLSETIPAFLSRLPPSSSLTSNIGDHWIRVANPCTSLRPTSEDWAGFTETATEHLEAYKTARNKTEASMQGKAKGTITRKLTPVRKQLESDILATAQSKRCTTGKWLLFVSSDNVDAVWAKIAKGTAENELGNAAKVAAKEDDGSEERGRLICVYTRDFADKGDVGRVLRKLKAMGFLENAEGGERILYYKCDALTHLGINANNEYGLKASLFSSKDILAIKET